MSIRNDLLEQILDKTGEGSGASIAEDMYFASTAERDQFTIDNPDRIVQGITCAVTNTGSYDYYQYDMANTQWRDANLIFQGSKGPIGPEGPAGETVDDASDIIYLSETYNSVDELTKKPRKITFRDNAGNATIFIDIDKSEMNSKDELSIGFTVHNASQSITYSEVLHDQCNLSHKVMPNSESIFTYSKDRGEWIVFDQGDIAINVDSSLLDFSSTAWSMVDGNRTYIIDLGVIDGIDPTVNGKTSKAIVEIKAYQEDYFLGKSQTVTLLSSNPEIGNTVWYRSTDGSDIHLQKFKKVGSDSNGFNDNGYIDDLSYDFKTLSEGKYYIDGWENSSYLPADWDSSDRIACLTVFGGYDGDSNGAFWLLGSHRKGVYAVAKSSGVESGWYKLDGGSQSLKVDSSNPLEVIVSDGGNHDVIAINDDNELVLGSRSKSVKSLAIATSGRRIIAYRSDDEGNETYDEMAFYSDIGKVSQRGKSTIWARGSEHEITEEEIQNDIVIQADSFVKDSDNNFSLTVTFPSLDVVTKYYWIPKVNDSKKDLLPKITCLEIKCWIDPEPVHEGLHRLYFKSKDNSFGWETSTKIGNFDGCYMQREHNSTNVTTVFEFNFMKIESGGSESGPMKGYYLQCAHADDVYDLDSSSPILTTDVAHDWNDSQEIKAEDIANALGKVQGDNVSTHTDNLGPKSLNLTTFKVERPEDEGYSTSQFAYTFFAFPLGFFTDDDGNPSEPTMVNTGSGNSSDWITSIVILDGQNYQVMVSPNRNSAPLLPSAKLVQPGVLRR